MSIFGHYSHAHGWGVPLIAQYGSPLVQFPCSLVAAPSARETWNARSATMKRCLSIYLGFHVVMRVNSVSKDRARL